MGMFDTIHFRRKFKCDVCGTTHSSTQTKRFENLLLDYQIGDVIGGSVLTGLVEEWILCTHKDTEFEEDPYREIKIYLVIWHKIFVDVVRDADEGERIMEKFGAGDLYFLYEKMYGRKNNFETKYRKLRQYVNIFSDFLKPDCIDHKLVEKRKKKPFLSFPSSEVLEALDQKDPLRYLVKQLEEAD